MNNIEAAKWAWSNLWSKEIDNKASIHVLDSIGWERGRAQSWIFTATDGAIKSKSMKNWRLEMIESRCMDGENFNAHVYVDSQWLPARSIEELEKLAGSAGCKQIIAFGHVPKSSYFIESTYETIDGVMVPKSSTFRLCGAMAKGRLMDEPLYAIPPSRIPCQDQVLTAQAKASTANLLKVLSQRSRSKVKKITAVYVVEDSTKRQILNGNEKESGLRLWLHHVESIVLSTPPASSIIDMHGSASIASLGPGRARSVASEIKSVSTSVTNLSSSFHRPTKCHGDFCTYCEEDELVSLRMDDGAGGAVQKEVQKALGRHRRNNTVNKSEWRQKAENALIEDDEPVLTIDPARAEAVGLIIGGSSADKFGTEEDEEQERLPMPKSSMANTVPNKSIALSRKDMQDIAQAGQVNKYSIWPELLQAWFFRMGRNLIRKKVSKLTARVPISSGHAIGAAILKYPIKEGFEGEESSENGLQGSPIQSNQMDSPQGGDGGGGCLKKSGFNDASLVMDLNGDLITQQGDSVPFDLYENQHGGRERRTVGQMSWYYSETSVCERCYNVYCELDKRRSKQLKSQLKERRKAKDEMETSGDRGREIERKIFQQRKFVSRLANTQNPIANKKIIRYGAGGSLWGNSVDQGGSVAGYGGSMASMGMGQPSYLNATIGFADSLASGSMASRFPTNGPPSLTVPRAPNGALPPLPWQLKDQSKLDQYNNQGSNFVRNISAKAQELKDVVKQEALLVEMQYKREAKMAAVSGTEAYNWEKLTGNGKNPILMDNGEPQFMPHIYSERKLEPVKKKVSGRSDSLLHPYQRHFENLKRGQEPEEAEANAGLHSVKVAQAGGYGTLLRAEEVNIRAHKQEMAKNKRRQQPQLLQVQEEGHGSTTQRSNPKPVRSVSAHILSPSKENSMPNQTLTAANIKASGLLSPSDTSQKTTQSPMSQLHKYGSLTSTSKPIPTKAQAMRPAPLRAPVVDDGDYDDGDDDDDDEGIGWSPFTVKVD